MISLNTWQNNWFCRKYLKFWCSYEAIWKLWGLAVLAFFWRIRSVCSSQEGSSYTLMEMSVNLIHIADLCFTEISTSLFSFFSALIFHPHCYLTLTLFRLQHYDEFSKYFLCGELYRLRNINDLDLTNFIVQAGNRRFLKEHVTCSFWWTL